MTEEEIKILRLAVSIVRGSKFARIMWRDPKHGLRPILAVVAGDRYDEPSAVAVLEDERGGHVALYNASTSDFFRVQQDPVFA